MSTSSRPRCCSTRNVRYAVTAAPFPVFNMHMTFRWALVPVESEVVLWEYPHSMGSTAASWAGRRSPARGWNFFGSGSRSGPDAAVFAVEIAEVLRARGMSGERVGVDRLETAAYLALVEAGSGSSTLSRRWRRRGRSRRPTS